MALSNVGMGGGGGEYIGVGKPEEILAKMIGDDLGIRVNEQALRMFMRMRWRKIQKLAHMIADNLES